MYSSKACYNRGMHNEKLYRLAMRIVLWGSILVLLTDVAEGFVRWQINQNFAFLNGAELEVITAGLFILLIALLWKKHE